MLRLITISLLIGVAFVLTGCIDFPSRSTRRGHSERQITGYKLRRNPVYDVLKRHHSEQQLGYMRIEEYKLEPQYQWVWVPD